MAYYTGAKRKAYLQADGLPIDDVSTRQFLDPTPALLSFITDIDRLQWGLQSDWGHPPYFFTVGMRDGGTTGSAGSFAAVTRNVQFYLAVPPRVKECRVMALVSGIVSVKLTTTHNNVTLSPGSFDFVPGDDTYDDPSLAYYHSTAGDPLVLAANTNEGVTTEELVTISITRADVQQGTTAGHGGILWGLAFFWYDQNATSWAEGDDAASLAISY